LRNTEVNTRRILKNLFYLLKIMAILIYFIMSSLYIWR